MHEKHHLDGQGAHPDPQPVSGRADEVPQEVLEQVWARRAARLAQAPPRQKAGQRIPCMYVRVGEECFGWQANHVLEVQPAGHITRVPRVPHWVAGVVNVRGTILPVLDLGRLLGLTQEGQDTSRDAYLVLVQTPQSRAVLRVDDVLSIEHVEIDQTRDATAEPGELPAKYVHTIIDRREEGLAVLLNLPALLADEHVAIHEEVE